MYLAEYLDTDEIFPSLVEDRKLCVFFMCRWITSQLKGRFWKNVLSFFLVKRINYQFFSNNYSLFSQGLKFLFMKQGRRSFFKVLLNNLSIGQTNENYHTCTWPLLKKEYKSFHAADVVIECPIFLHPLLKNIILNANIRPPERTWYSGFGEEKLYIGWLLYRKLHVESL